MYKRCLRPLAAGALALSLLLPSAAAAWYPEKEHLPVDYAQMAYTGCDDTALQTALDALRQLSDSSALQTEDPNTRQQVRELYRTILQEYDMLTTQATLIDLRYDADLHDQTAADESLRVSDLLTQAWDQCYLTLALLVDTPYEDIVSDDAGADALDYLRWYQPLTEEEAELYRRESELVKAYEQAMAQQFQVTVDGRTWTFETLDADDTLSSGDYWEIRTLLEQAENEAAGPIFLQLVQVRHQIAQAAGFDNYADYAYLALYNRDYTTRDIRTVCSAAKKSLLPLYTSIQETALSGTATASLLSMPAPTGEQVLDAIGPFMGQIDPELGDTFDFMRRHHLYDIEAADSKQPVGYTVALPAYGSAFIFNDPFGSYQDYSTMIHEFGHFAETFHNTQHDFWSFFSIDVGEIHSQGLEVLFTAYSQDLFGAGGKAFTWSTLLNMVDSVLEGCMYDEFQQAVYSQPDMTLPEMNRLFRDISEEYGYTYGPDETESYFWVEIPHTFQQPMYYVSYATSALSAIDLWLLSLKDRQKAVDVYMELSALSMSLPYCQAVEQVGLRDVFRYGTVADLARELQQQLDRDHGKRTAAIAPRADYTPLIVGGGAVLLLALAGAGVAGKRRRRPSPDVPASQGSRR